MRANKLVGWILGIVGVLSILGQASTTAPILSLGFRVSIFHITVNAVLLLIAAYYLIK